MPYPTIYAVTYSYTGFQMSQGNNSFPGTQIDADLAGLRGSVSSLALFTQSVMRSDGALSNGIVTFDSLSPSLQTAGIAPASAWVTGFNYLANSNAVINGNLYRATVTHTSGVFATDLAAGKWILISPLTAGIIPPAQGGTGINNGSNTLTLSANLSVQPQSSGVATWNAGTLGGQSAVLRLPNPTNLYVSATGNDSNNGTSAGSAFLTLQKAVNVALGSYDFQGSNLIINVGAGAFAGAAISGSNPGAGGAAWLVLLGAGSTNTTINTTINADNGARVQIGSTKIAAPLVANIISQNDSIVKYYDSDLNLGASQSALVYCINGGQFQGQNALNLKISGAASSAFLISTESSVQLSANATHTITGTPNFPNGFVNIINGSGFNPGINSVFVGAATGPVYNMSLDCWIDMEQNASPLPGNASGIRQYGSVYYGVPLDNVLAAGTLTLTLNSSNAAITAGVSGAFARWDAGTLSGAASLNITNSAAPGTPAAGSVSLWLDSTTKRFRDINDAGVIGTTVVADAGAANNFLTAISTAGAISKAQPSASNLSNGVTGSGGAVVLATAPIVTSLTNSSGPLVIGATPAYAWGGSFNVFQMGSGTGILASTSGAGTAEFESNVYWDGANYKYMTTNPASKVGFGNGSFAVATAPSGTAGNTATMTNYLFLSNAGLIGIGAGNLSPNYALDVSGVVGWRTTGVTLANALNSNIALPTTSRVRISGPSAVFSVGGFTGGTDGARLHIYNSVAQAMTIVNEDASSTAGNRIKTLTGANVVLRAGTSFATLSYDATDSRWILENSN